MKKKEIFFLMISFFLICSCVNSETKNYSKSDISTSNFQTIIHEGVNREYVLYVPDSYDGSNPVPVVLNFHGFNGDAYQYMNEADMRRLAEALGGYSETLSGLSGLGDVLLSCSSRQSRNFLFGELLGNGNDKHIAREKIGGVVEGWFSASSVMKKQKELGIDLPICKTVYDILYNEEDIKISVSKLLNRPIKPE